MENLDNSNNNDKIKERLSSFFLSRFATLETKFSEDINVLERAKYEYYDIYKSCIFIIINSKLFL